MFYTQKNYQKNDNNNDKLSTYLLIYTTDEQQLEYRFYGGPPPYEQISPTETKFHTVS